jgi:glycine C-acetyltransferase
MPEFKNATAYSLADFHYNDNPDVLQPPADFEAWMAHPDVKAGFSFFLQQFLAAPKANTEILSAVDGQRRRVVNLTSYNYLGLATHPEVIQAVKDNVEKYGLSASGAPLVSGTTDLHVKFASQLAKLKGKEDCLLFSSGYGGNVGAIQGIMRKGDVVIMDEKGHKSLIDGVTLSGAKLVMFAHNNPADLEAKLEQFKGKRCLVVCEGVYSMDGDLVRLPEIVDVCDKYHAPIYMDEAHSSLMFGKNGGGIGEHFGLEHKIGISYGTLSKSFGAVGGFICANANLTRYMRGYASSWNFSCAPSPVIVAGLIKSLEVATRDTLLRDQLWSNTKYFKERLDKMGLNLGDTQSQVIPIIIGSSAELLFKFTAEMQMAGLFLQPIDYPAVPAHARRFRISMSSQLTKEDMDKALDIIENVVAKGLKQAGILEQVRAIKG